jgi:pre-mRNA branch site protein p14
MGTWWYRVLTFGSYNVTVEELFDLFGKFGPIRYDSTLNPPLHLRDGHADQFNRQVRQGIANNTKGTAFVVYEDVMDAKQACDKLNGFNFQNRYLVGTSSPVPIHEPF